jgi:hypothetical protein
VAVVTDFRVKRNGALLRFLLRQLVLSRCHEQLYDLALFQRAHGSCLLSYKFRVTRLASLADPRRLLARESVHVALNFSFQ